MAHPLRRRHAAREPRRPVHPGRGAAPDRTRRRGGGHPADAGAADPSRRRAPTAQLPRAFGGHPARDAARDPARWPRRGAGDRCRHARRKRPRRRARRGRARRRESPSCRYPGRRRWPPRSRPPGFKGDRYLFLGFLPRKGAERARLLARAAEEEWSVVLFEAPPRLGGLLEDLAKLAGGATPGGGGPGADEAPRGDPGRHAGRARPLLFGAAPRGELTVVLEGTGAPPEPPDRTEDAMAQATRLLAEGLTRKEVVSPAQREPRPVPERRLSTGHGVAVMIRRALPLVLAAGGADRRRRRPAPRR